MLVPLGLFSWLAAGLATGALASRLLPGRPRLPLASGLLVGIWGGLLGGVLATALGFGGLVSLDVRSAVTAGLAAVLCLLLTRAFLLR